MGNVVGEMRRSRENYQRRSAHQTKEETLTKTVTKYLLNDDADGVLEFLNHCFMGEVIDEKFRRLCAGLDMVVCTGCVCDWICDIYEVFLLNGFNLKIIVLKIEKI